MGRQWWRVLRDTRVRGKIRGVTGGAKRARGGPTFTDEQEMSMIEFVKEYHELYTKANAWHVDKPEKIPWEQYWSIDCPQPPTIWIS